MPSRGNCHNNPNTERVKLSASLPGDCSVAESVCRTRCWMRFTDSRANPLALRRAGQLACMQNLAGRRLCGGGPSLCSGAVWCGPIDLLEALDGVRLGVSQLHACCALFFVGTRRSAGHPFVDLSCVVTGRRAQLLAALCVADRRAECGSFCVSRPEIRATAARGRRTLPSRACSWRRSSSRHHPSGRSRTRSRPR